MGKQQAWSVTVCIFLFLCLGSQIHATKGLSLRTTLSINQQNLKENDLIKKLPGQPSVNFRQYGGYVAVNETTGRFLYYYFVEATKSNNSTPLVIWFNGGPGCSSIGAGAFRGHGPFRVHNDGKTLYLNPYSWNNEANILYVESPALVGFSYMNTPSDVKREGDKTTAEDNYVFLAKWFERFPEYKGREFYIGAESYGGHYGPQLAQIILNRNNQTFINLQGIFLGNPTLDLMLEHKPNEEYAVSHALVSQELVDQRELICRSKEQNGNHKCSDAIYEIMTLTESVDTYNIYAHACLNSTLTNKPKEHTTVVNFDPCSEHYVTAYLNEGAVQETMHANTTKLTYPWKQCNEHHVTWPQDDQVASMLPILQDLMGKGIRILVYSGDLDSAVSVLATMSVLKTMNLTVENMWRPWFCEREVGGYTEEYKGNFTFATVRGSGHIVPSDQPIRALTLFTSFIRNNPLPQL